MGHGGDCADVCGVDIDRSKMHILLCDKDADTACRVMLLLQNCSYQVTTVKSAGQVITALDSCCEEVDLILTEVELPKEKSFKMLKHIVRQKQLQRIPVVMMSARDEMAVVVKCLRLGAVDYLLKPLRTNELLNLWTHTWRRRRMLGLAEKHFMNGKLKVPFDILVSETSESNNTNSTNLFSDDTDDFKRVISRHGGNNVASCEMEAETSPKLELSLKPSLNVSTDVAPGRVSKAGSVLSPPKKSQIKLGESSAFFSYAKVSNQCTERLVKGQSDAEASSRSADSRPHVQSSCPGNDNSSTKRREEREHLFLLSGDQACGIPPEKFSSGVAAYPWDCSNSSCRPENGSGEGDCNENHVMPWNHPCLPYELADGKLSSSNRFPLMQFCDNEGDVTAAPVSLTPGSLFLNGRMASSALQTPASLVPASMHLYHGLPTDGGIAAGIPNIHGLSPSHGLSLTTPFSYYSFGLPLGAHQLGSFPGWPAVVSAPMMERKLCQAARREAALNKFRRKRKDRCFEKKIRYVSRKKLAEQRPRIRGQFVRRGNDTDINENGGLYEYDQEDEDDEGDSGDIGTGSSPESIAEEA